MNITRHDDGTVTLKSDDGRLEIAVSIAEKNLIDPKFGVIIKTPNLKDVLEVDVAHRSTHFSRLIYGQVRKDPRT